MVDGRIEIRQMGGGSSRLIACLAAIVFVLSFVPGLAFADKSAVVADQSTLDTWVGHVRNSTENVGRIWTDKTVQTDDITLSGSTSGSIKVDKADGADFLVGLSALSSTSNLTSVSGKPLDIVLVMDESYSMRQTDSEESYVEVYADNLDTSKTYYYYDGASLEEAMKSFSGTRRRTSGVTTAVCWAVAGTP